MDMFMDKLAQKLTAQEMIKANMEADTEQMNKLKGQVKDYSECLEQVQKLAETGIAKINKMESDVKTGGEQRRAEIVEALDKAGQQILEKLDESGRQHTDELAVLEAKQAESFGELKKQCTEDREEFQQQLAEKLDALGENVHKECVKVYRNVQAAVVEENNKQTDNLTEMINAAVKGYRGKLNAILSISIISMILALGSVVLHILQMMNFKFF